MVYKLLKIWAELAFSLYFRRIFISGIENIPKKGAVLFLVNHPNTFLEACVIAAFQHRNLHFLVRGDMFEKKWLLPILKATNQIPIFRFKDGFGKLRGNKSTFDISYKVMADQHAMLMFPEASSEMDKYLRPLQKGAARLVLGTIEEYDIEEIYVIPTGIHYYDAPRSRSDVILKFDKAFHAREWYDKNINLDDKIPALTAEFQRAMNHAVVSISHLKHESIYRKSYLLMENDQLRYQNSGVIKSEEGYSFIKTLFHGLNRLNENKIIELEGKLCTYQGSFKNLQSLDLHIKLNFFEKLSYLFPALLSFVIGLPGFIVYAPSLILSRLFAKKKIAHITFYAPVRIAVNMGLHLISTIVLIIILYPLFSFFELLIVLIFLQLSLFSSGVFIDYSGCMQHFFNFKILRKKESLRNIRDELTKHYFSFFK